MGEAIGLLLALGDLTPFGLLGERPPALGDLPGLFALNGLSSLIGDFWEAAIDFLFKRGFRDSAPAPGLLGVAPFLTGVDGGRVFRKCSGLSFGPNDTLAFLDLDSKVSVDFLFFPELAGVFGNAALIIAVPTGKDLLSFFLFTTGVHLGDFSTETGT